MASKISIVVPTLNSVATLQRCIDSVIGQGYADKELLVIDGDSKDGTQSVIEHNGRHIRYWISESDNGIYGAFNKGIAAASGDWILFLGADDFLWNENVLKRIALGLNTAPQECLVAYGRVAVVGKNGQLIEVIGGEWDHIKFHFRQRMALAHQGVFHHRNLFEKNGFFNESYRIVGDYELLLRELKSNDALYLNETIIAGMQHGGTSNNPHYRHVYIKECARVRRTHKITFFSSYWVMFILKSYLRILLLKMFGIKFSNLTADLYRMLGGKPRIWFRHR